MPDSSGVLENEEIKPPSVQGFSSSIFTGDAVVSYPLQIPPSAGGFAPSLSLSYSSGAVEDMRIGISDKNSDDKWESEFVSQGSHLGMGWDLSGIPQISKSFGREKDANDKDINVYFLSLNGKSFKLVFDPIRTADLTDDFPKKDNYKQEDYDPYDGKKSWKEAYYRTEPESYLKIIRTAVTPKTEEEPCDQDDRNWEVWTGDGTKYYFEPMGFGVKTVGGIHQRYVRTFNRFVLTKAVDVFNNINNIIKYSYGDIENKKLPFNSGGDDRDVKCFTENIVGLLINGEEIMSYTADGNPVYLRSSYLKEIAYGKGLSNKLKFNYSARDDTQVKNYDMQSKINFWGEKKLDNIKVYLGNNLLRTYQLSYFYSDVPSGGWGQSKETDGRLLLASIDAIGTGSTKFPASQSFCYYSREARCVLCSGQDSTGCSVRGNELSGGASFLMARANNGYGGIVEYKYEDNEARVSFSMNDWRYNDQHDMSYIQKRHRLTELKTYGLSNGEQYQKAVYEYPEEFANNTSCVDWQGETSEADKRACPNAHAVAKDASGLINFEFLGYRYVVQKNYSKEEGENETQYPTISYKYYQGVEKGELKDYGKGKELVSSFEPLPNSGSIARQTTSLSDGTILSINENDSVVLNYSEDKKRTFIYNKESRSCSDLDISNSALRKASRTVGYLDFSLSVGNTISSLNSGFGNIVKSEIYEVNSCEKEGNNIFSTKIKLNSPVLYRSTITDYKEASVSPNYLFGKPNYSEVRDKNEKTLSLSLTSYSDKGLPVQTLAVDADSLTGGSKSNVKAVMSKTAYDSFGNVSSQTPYGDYALGNLENQGGKWAYQVNANPSDARVTTTTYDSTFSAFPKIVTNPLNFTTQTVYDFETGGANVLGLPVKSIDANGKTTQMAYDSFGRIIKTVSPDNRDSLEQPTTAYEYFDNQKDQTGSALAVKVSKKDRIENGKPIYLSNWVFYDDLGRKLQTQSQSLEGKIFADKTIYDTLGRAVKSIASQERQAGIGKYLDINVSNSQEYVSTTTYDNQGRLVRTTSPDKTCSLIDYEGKRTISYDPNKAKSVIETDSLGRNYKTESYQNPSAQVLGASTEKKSFGQGVKEFFIKVADSLVNFFSKLARGESPFGFSRLLSGGSDCDSNAVSYPGDFGYSLYSFSETTYDSLDRPEVISIKKSNGEELSKSQTAYDGFGRVKTSVDPDLGTTEVLAFDALGNQLKVKDNAGQVKSFVYDDLERMTDICQGETCASGAGTKARLVYDKDKLVSEITPNILQKTYFYNDKGQVYSTKFQLLGGLGELGWLGDRIEYYTFYDAGGKPVTQTINGPSTNQPWVNELIDDSRQVFDDIGRLRETYFGHSEKNSSGNLVSLNNREYFVKDIKYDRFGLISERSLSGGIKEAFGYDEADKSLRLKTHTVSNNLLSLNYNSYDNAGNILQMRSSSGSDSVSSSYSYDSFNRLEAVSGAINASYSYDELGRMTTKNEKENLTFIFDNQTPVNAPKSYKVSQQNKNLTYDSSGNLKTLTNGNQMTYDQDNRLIEVKGSDGSSIAKYTYD